MYKVKDSSNLVHLVDADSYEYDKAVAGVVNFWKEKVQVASFDRPVCVEFVQEEKKVEVKVFKEKEYVYVPYYPPYYQYPSYRYPEIKWYSNCGGSLDNATITTRTTSGYSQVI